MTHQVVLWPVYTGEVEVWSAPMELETLLRAARDEEPGVWKRLLPPLEKRLRRFFRPWGFDEADVEDLAQTTVAAIVHQIPGFVPRETLTQWVFGIARNQARLVLRKRQARHKFEQERPYSPPPSPTSPSSHVHRRKLLEIVGEELAQLAPHEQRAIENDLAHGDAGTLAEHENIARSSARTRRRRAKLKLRQRVLARLEGESARAPPAPPVFGRSRTPAS